MRTRVLALQLTRGPTLYLLPLALEVAGLHSCPVQADATEQVAQLGWSMKSFNRARSLMAGHGFCVWITLCRERATSNELVLQSVGRPLLCPVGRIYSLVLGSNLSGVWGMRAGCCFLSQQAVSDSCLAPCNELTGFACMHALKLLRRRAVPPMPALHIARNSQACARVRVRCKC